MGPRLIYKKVPEVVCPGLDLQKCASSSGSLAGLTKEVPEVVHSGLDLPKSA